MVAHIVESSQVIDCCRAIARLSEQPGSTTRTFLSAPMRDVHLLLRGWMDRLGMQVSVDPAGNLRGRYASLSPNAPSLLIGSHIDTVRCAGAFDGVLGVVLGLALIESLNGRHLHFSIEVVAFSDEEGVRFGVPFIGSRALVGAVDADLLQQQDESGLTLAQAIRDFGLDPSAIPHGVLQGPVLGYLEFHIEQGPVLDSLSLPLGVVQGIAGQTRRKVIFRGQANHAGTTPMHLRRDALAGAAEWVTVVEAEARGISGLVATVGRLEVLPGASNVIAGEVRTSLDVRHAVDNQRVEGVHRILAAAGEIARRRGLVLELETQLEQPAVRCDPEFVAAVEKAVVDAGYPVHRMTSGAGHDAMILAKKVPAAMLFVRSPGGISHHPDERVLPGDVEAALKVGLHFLDHMEKAHS